MQGNISREAIETLLREGLRNCEIERQLGAKKGSLCKRIQTIRSQWKQQAEIERQQQGMTVHYLSPEEVEQRYGSPGLLAYKPQYMIVDIYAMGKAKERRRGRAE